MDVASLPVVVLFRSLLLALGIEGGWPAGVARLLGLTLAAWGSEVAKLVPPTLPAADRNRPQELSRPLSLWASVLNGEGMQCCSG